MNINFNPNEFDRIKRINLSDYYRNNVERKIIHCQICKFDISKSDVFEHTISQRHKYNKLFIAIVQGRSYNTDIDFIVLNIDRLQCRFCNFVIINSDKDDLVISHLQDATHVTMRQIFLDMIDTSRQRHCVVRSDLLKPVDDSVKPDKVYEKHVNKPTKNIKKKAKVPKETKLITKESTDTNNVNQNESLKYSVLSRDCERKREEKLPECIPIGKGHTCICTICSITMPTSNVVRHIDGKKHKRNMLKFPKSRNIENQVKIPKETKLITKESTDTNNVDRNESLKHSVLSRDCERKREEELPECIAIGKGDTCICTICFITTNTSNVIAHIDSKKHNRKMLKFSKSRNIEKQVKIPKETKLITKESTDTNNVDRNESLKYSVLSRDCERKGGQKLPECITIGKGRTCICTICSITMPTSNVVRHIDGKKHKRNMLKFPKSRNIENQVKIPKETKLITKESMDTNNVDRNESLKHSVLSRDCERKREEELPECIAIGKGDTCICTICFITTNTSNVIAHIDSKKHNRKMLKFSKSRNIEKQVKIPKETKLITKESTDTNNVDRNESLKYSVLSRDCERKGGQKLPECITIGKGRTCICTICSITMPTSNVVRHIDGKKHKRNMLKFPKSRNIENQVKIPKETKLITKESTDTNNVDRNESLKYSVLSRDCERKGGQKLPECITIGKGYTCICTICSITTHTSNVIAHIDSKKHKRNMLIFPKSRNIEKQVKIPKETKLITKESTDTNNVDRNESLKYSVLSRDCERKREEKLPECIAIGKEDTRIRTICSITTHTSNVVEHIDNKKHKRNMLKFPKSPSPKSEVRTTIAASRRKNNINNATEKVTELKHSRKKLEVADNIDKNNVLKCPTPSGVIKVKSGEELLNCMSFGKSSVYECKFCLVEFSCSSSRAIKQHNKGKIHQHHRRESLTSMSQELELKSTFDEISEEGSDCEIFYEEFEEFKKKTYTCTMCFKTIPRNKLNIEMHKNSKKHKNKVKKSKISFKNSKFLSAKNSSGHISRRMNDIHYCEICKKCLPKNSLITKHVNSKQHKKILLSSTPGEHVNSRKHKNKILSAMPWEHVDTRKKILSPTPGCSRKTGNKDANRGELSQVIFVDDTWACKICRVGIRDISLIKDHISSSDHKEKALEGTEQLYEFESAKKLWVCKLCNKLLHKSTKIIHVNSKHCIPNDVCKRNRRR